MPSQILIKEKENLKRGFIGKNFSKKKFFSLFCFGKKGKKFEKRKNLLNRDDMASLYELCSRFFVGFMSRKSVWIKKHITKAPIQNSWFENPEYL